jgi:CRP-like cAMP-binding protein
MRRFIDRLGAFLRIRALRCDVSLADAGVDAQTVAARIGRSELFCNVEAETIHELLEAMEVTPVVAGATVMRQGERSDTYLVLAAGEALVTHTRDGEETRILATLTEPTGLGEEALLGVETRPVSVTMESDGISLRIRRDAFATFVGEHAVEWVTRDDPSAGRADVCWLWFGAEGRKRVARAGALVLLLSQLRERMADLDRSRRFFCCCKDGKESAIAAFVLRQRGFEAYAVRDGRNAIARDAA